MTKTLVTGGTGFIGLHLVRALAERGDELRLLVRDDSATGQLGVEFEPALGDVNDARSVRKAMKGVDRLFHVAGTTSLRQSDRERVFDVNVGGVRTVMEEALRAGVERVVHTSSIAAVGPAPPGETADEDQVFTAGALGIAYVNSKHEGEMEAMRVAARGLPLVVVNPSFVLGPDDPKGTSNELVTRFLQRRIPAYVDGGLNIVDVRDVAAGHLLADERGEEGSRYILGGRNFTLQRLFADLGRIAGVPPPPLKLPGELAESAVSALERTGIPLPVSADEVRSASLWWTYRNDKATRELGFRARPHEETLEDTVRWQLDHLVDAPGTQEQATDAVFRAGGALTEIASKLPRPRIPMLRRLRRR
jgi:dihydroflavonol-4-reductase